MTDGHVPVILVSPSAIQGEKPARTLIALIDTGSDCTWISRKVLPLGTTPSTIPAAKGDTLAGTFTSEQAVFCKDTRLPEFSGTKRIQRLMARVINMNGRYDMIIGRDLLTQLKFKIDFAEHIMQWDK